MTPHIESIAGFTATVFSAIAGAVTVPSVAEIATNETLPDWAKWMLGPLGALVGMIVAIKWLTNRLDKAELAAAVDRATAVAREEKRQIERDSQMAQLIELGTRSNNVIEQNSRLLERLDQK